MVAVTHHSRQPEQAGCAPATGSANPKAAAAARRQTGPGLVGSAGRENAANGKPVRLSRPLSEKERGSGEIPEPLVIG